MYRGNPDPFLDPIERKKFHEHVQQLEAEVARLTRERDEARDALAESKNAFVRLKEHFDASQTIPTYRAYCDRILQAKNDELTALHVELLSRTTERDALRAQLEAVTRERDESRQRVAQSDRIGRDAYAVQDAEAKALRACVTQLLGALRGLMAPLRVVGGNTHEMNAANAAEAAVAAAEKLCGPR